MQKIFDFTVCLISIVTFESTLSSKVELAVNSDNASPKDIKVELVFDSFDSSNEEPNEVVSDDPSLDPWLFSTTIASDVYEGLNDA